MRWFVLLARTHGNPISLAESIRRKLHEVDPARSVYEISTLNAHLSDAFAETRIRTVLLRFFAFTAISLASVRAVRHAELRMVELVGIEPTTSSLRTMRSPS